MSAIFQYPDRIIDSRKAERSFRLAVLHLICARSNESTSRAKVHAYNLGFYAGQLQMIAFRSTSLELAIFDEADRLRKLMDGEESVDTP